MIEPRSRLIVALDLPDRPAALAAVRQLSGHAGYFKVGLEIFIREGPRLVEEIRDAGEQIFLDLKLHDIPNTAAGAVRSACKLGVKMLTVHASGGRSMLEAARKAAEASSDPPLLLAVTALTSLSRDDILSLGVNSAPSDWVGNLASLANQAGLRGLVASPLEIPRLRSSFGDEMRLIIPGIRPAGTDAQDHSRAAQPRAAILAGADFLVVGRPILRAPDPARAADEIVAEIGEALRERGGIRSSLAGRPEHRQNQ
jgi:orotidine-5'-phosphate decarboxylase